MAFLLRRQLNDEEKQTILTRFGRKCFATGHPIPESETVQFDHILAYAAGGESTLNNIAPMCAQHNKEKGTLPLEDFRIKLKLKDFFERGERQTLRHLLTYLHTQGDIPAFGCSVSLTNLSDGLIQIESSNMKHLGMVYTCPVTKWKYFYCTLDASLIDSDDEDEDSAGLQPRYLIQDKVFSMFRHFQNNTVMQPSIGRIVNSKIRIFDGQHKIAALLLCGRRQFECKIYIDANIRLLNQTNIAAHDAYAQTRFFSSVMVRKLGSQFGEDFEHYKRIEEPSPKSESGFMEYLTAIDKSATRGDLNKRFRSFLYSSLIENEENKLKPMISSSNRRSDANPITMDMLEKSIFSTLLYREPLPHNMTTDEYKRDIEISNIIEVMNMLHELSLGSWNPASGPTDETQRKLSRIIGSKSMMAWAEIFKDALCGKLELLDEEDRAMPLYRKLTEEQIRSVRKMVERLVSWSRWRAPASDEIDRVLAGNKKEIKDWFRSHGLTTGYLLGATE